MRGRNIRFGANATGRSGVVSTTELCTQLDKGKQAALEGGSLDGISGRALIGNGKPGQAEFDFAGNPL